MKKLLLCAVLIAFSISPLLAARRDPDGKKKAEPAKQAPIDPEKRGAEKDEGAAAAAAGPRWTKREQAYLATVTKRLEALPDEDSRKLMVRYFKFLQEPTQDRADEFASALLKKREQLKAPVNGVGLFSADALLCEGAKGECRYSVGNISDKHLVPLLKKGDKPALEVAMTRFLVAAPSQAEYLSYIAAFRTPQVLTRHTHEVLSVLYKMRKALAEYNPGPACYHFKFFEHKITEEMVHKALSPKEAQDLLTTCQNKPSKG